MFSFNPFSSDLNNYCNLLQHQLAPRPQSNQQSTNCVLLLSNTNPGLCATVPVHLTQTNPAACTTTMVAHALPCNHSMANGMAPINISDNHVVHQHMPSNSSMLHPFSYSSPSATRNNLNCNVPPLNSATHPLEFNLFGRGELAVIGDVVPAAQPLQLHQELRSSHTHNVQPANNRTQHAEREVNDNANGAPAADGNVDRVCASESSQVPAISIKEDPENENESNSAKEASSSLLAQNDSSTSPDRPFECVVCGKRFCRKCSLRVHMRLHSEQAYECRVCQKKFARASNRDQHQRTHSQERPYQCRFCAKAFTQKHSLLDHENMHQKVKPHKCEYCDKAFTVKSNLKAHYRVHTGERPFECDQCHKTYSSRSGWKAHLRKKCGAKTAARI